MYIDHTSRNYPTWLWHLMITLAQDLRPRFAHRWGSLTPLQWHVLRATIEYYLAALAPRMLHVSLNTPSLKVKELQQIWPEDALRYVVTAMVINELEEALP